MKSQRKNRLLYNQVFDVTKKTDQISDCILKFQMSYMFYVKFWHVYVRRCDNINRIICCIYSI